jgi:hypothetical protein
MSIGSLRKSKFSSGGLFKIDLRGCFFFSSSLFRWNFGGGETVLVRALLNGVSSVAGLMPFLHGQIRDSLRERRSCSFGLRLRLMMIADC